MKTFTVPCFLALLLLLSLPAAAQESGSKPKTSVLNQEGTKPGTKPDETDPMAKWQRYMTPGEMHRMMAKWDGNWNVEITMWMDTSTAAQSATGKVENKMIMNGLYQISKYSGDIMGMPFEGQGTTGFDNHRGLFETTWIDNMGSGIIKLEGFWNGANKTINLKGRMVDPSTATIKSIRQTIKIIDDNTQIMEMFTREPDGKEFKTMQIKYTRAK
jgi:hypothetical protein